VILRLLLKAVEQLGKSLEFLSVDALRSVSRTVTFRLIQRWFRKKLVLEEYANEQH
jgi:uncharacterized membrane protein